jgi:hypothetical protein
MAVTAYATEYSDALKLEAFKSQAIATALLSFAVVEGQRQAVKLLQTAIGHNLVCDGIIGNMIVDAANAICKISSIRYPGSRESKRNATLLQMSLHVSEMQTPYPPYCSPHGRYGLQRTRSGLFWNANPRVFATLCPCVAATTDAQTNRRLRKPSQKASFDLTGSEFLKVV